MTTRPDPTNDRGVPDSPDRRVESHDRKRAHLRGGRVAEVTGWDLDTVIKVTKLDLADSALHAPQAGFGETDFYSDFLDKAAVLIVRLARNRPLPDGNK